MTAPTAAAHAATTRPETRFVLPPGSEATEPPEHRGLTRDEVRMLVARPGTIEHLRFRDLAEQLDPGDLVVVNTSATLPAALLAGRADGTHSPVHVSTTLDDGSWVVEVRHRDHSGPELDLLRGELLRLPAGVRLRLTAPYPDHGVARSRLWTADVEPITDPIGYLLQYGEPIRYQYLRGRFPLSDYQTVYAGQPGSAEMPSAGRPFTTDLLLAMIRRGITIAPVVLHTGVSSPELHEPPTPERFSVPAPTARLVRSTRVAGGRVVAVGTTVVRALESAATPDGEVHACRGWTDLVLGPQRPARVTTGLITGWHPPQASHLLLLEAVAGRDLVGSTYRAALQRGYLWHEFGDSALLLPALPGQSAEPSRAEAAALSAASVAASAGCSAVPRRSTA
jgi:S-adenosylmethionine:tRNA ribosyltransferase-isomerase